MTEEKLLVLTRDDLHEKIKDIDPTHPNLNRQMFDIDQNAFDSARIVIFVTDGWCIEMKNSYKTYGLL